MLPLCFRGSDLPRNILVDQVCSPHLIVFHQGNAMQRQVKNLPVFAPLSHCPLQRVSREDLQNQLTGVPSLIVGYPHISNIERGELVLVILKEFLESGICQLDASLPIENYNPQRAILYQRVQVSGLFVQINCQAVSLADLGPDDQSDCGHNQHEEGNFGEQRSRGRKQMHRDDNSKVQRKHRGDNSPDSLTHGNPDDRNETQIEMIVAPVLASEHHPQDGKNRRTLAAAFCQPSQTEFLSEGRRPGWIERAGYWHEPIANMRKYMDEKKRGDAH